MVATTTTRKLTALERLARGSVCVAGGVAVLLGAAPGGSGKSFVTLDRLGAGDDRSTFVQSMIEEYERSNRSARSIRNGRDLGPLHIFSPCGLPWYSKPGWLRLEVVVHEPLDGGSYRPVYHGATAQERYAWVARRIAVKEDGWWSVGEKVRTLHRRGDGSAFRYENQRYSWLEDTSGCWKDNRWFYHISYSADVPGRRGLRVCDGCYVGYAVRHSWGAKGRGRRHSQHDFFNWIDPAELYVSGLVDLLNARWRTRSSQPEGGPTPWPREWNRPPPPDPLVLKLQRSFAAR